VTEEAEHGSGTLGRHSFDKQYTGDLVAAGKGEMLTARSVTKGSSAYVAIERVVGALQGKKGAFVLQTSGAMARVGDQRMTVDIVPDSGTDELTGIAGKMVITIDGGKHLFALDYTLPQ